MVVQEDRVRGGGVILDERLIRCIVNETCACCWGVRRASQRDSGRSAVHRTQLITLRLGGAPVVLTRVRSASGHALSSVTAVGRTFLNPIASALVLFYTQVN